MRKNVKMSDAQIGRYSEMITSALTSMEETEWQKPWNTTMVMPKNFYRKKEFGIINKFMLMLMGANKYKVQLYMTLNQIKNINGTFKYEELSIKKGERAYPVWSTTVFYRNEDGGIIYPKQYDELPEEEKEEFTKCFADKIYPEWNIEQTNFAEIYPEDYAKLLEQMEQEKDDIACTNEVLDKMIEGGEWICPIGFGGGSACFYPNQKRISLPLRSTFISNAAFYGTALHEMAHSTKIAIRRDFGKKSWGDEGYAIEELVAEMTSAILCMHVGIEKTIDDQHKAYVASWRKEIKKEKNKFIPLVISHIFAAARLMLRHYAEVESTGHIQLSDHEKAKVVTEAATQLLMDIEDDQLKITGTPSPVQVEQLEKVGATYDIDNGVYRAPLDLITDICTIITNVNEAA